ncbi:MAG: alanine racemase [Clostridia bacterium]|nr:alanine racemase [Clostridia bacterium]
MSVSSPYAYIDTPALLIDMDVVGKNIGLMQKKADDFGVALRPHTKTHKMPALARMQLRAGARGLTVAKTGEAEVMAREGFDDIFIANEIVGEDKLRRILKLHRTMRVIVGVDNKEQILAMARIFDGQSRPLPLRIEIEVGENRTGVLTVEQAVELSRVIRSFPCLETEGIFCHEGHTYKADTLDECRKMCLESHQRMLMFAQALRADGERLDTVSAGATPSMLTSPVLKGITEIRPGTYILMDAAQGRVVGDYTRAAATVLATVISKPTRERVVIDAGAKALTAQRRIGGICDTPGNGLIKNGAGARISGVFDEHGIINDGDFWSLVEVGDKIEIIPNHICPAVNLYDRAYLVSGGNVVDIVNIEGRGKIS